MAKYSFNYDFFFPDSEDGNRTLESQRARVNQAIKCLITSDDFIEFPDGKKCYSLIDLEQALSQYEGQKRDNKSKSKKQFSYDFPLVLSAIAFLIVAIVYFFTTEGYLLLCIVGAGISIYCLTNKCISKTWKANAILLVASFLLLLLGDFFSNPFIITIICNSIAFVLATVAFFRASRNIENTALAILSVVICFLFAAVSVFWALLLFQWSEIRSFLTVNNISLKIAFVLMAIIFGWLGIKRSTITSSEVYKRPKPISLALLVITILFAAFAYSEVSDYHAELEYEESRPHYEDIVYAIEHGHVRKGMTYEEIEAVCGPANKVYRDSRGISSAFYGHIDAYTDKAHLVFSNGRLYDWHY